MYPEEKIRSQVIGFILGSMALGVLLGYPFGGILYAFSGKSAPFYIIAVLTFMILGNIFFFFAAVFVTSPKFNSICISFFWCVVYFSASVNLHGFTSL